MTLTDLIARAGGDEAVYVERPDIMKATKTKGGQTRLTLATVTTAVTVNDVLAMSWGARAGYPRKVPLLVWIPESAWDAAPVVPAETEPT